MLQSIVTPITVGICLQVDVEAEHARMAYERSWQRFRSSAGCKPSAEQKLAYIDIPWPAEEYVSSEQLISVVFAGTLVCLPV